MGKRAAIAVLVCVWLIGAARPINGREVLNVRVSPAITFEPAVLRIVAEIEADARNRTLEIAAQSEGYTRSSQVQVDGLDAQRVWDFEFRDLPRGNYEVTGVLTGTGGRRAVVTRLVVVVSQGH